MAEQPSRSSKARFRAFRKELRENKDALKKYRRKRRGRYGVEPDQEDEAPTRAQAWSYVTRYAQWLRPYRWALAGIFALALASQLINLVVPLGPQVIIDRIVNNDALPRPDKFYYTNLVGVGLLLAMLIVQGLEVLRSFRMSVVQSRVIQSVRQRVFDHLLCLPMSRLSDMKTGGILSRLQSDVDGAVSLVQSAVISPALAGLRLVLTLAILFWISPAMVGAAMLFVVPIVVANFFYYRRVRPIWRKVYEERAQINGRVGEVFGGVRVVRSFSRERHERAAYGTGHHSVIRKHLYARYLMAWPQGLWTVMSGAAGVMVAWIGGLLVIRGTLTTGQIFSTMLYSMYMIRPIVNLMLTWGEVQQSLAAMHRVFDVLDMPEDMPDAPDAKPAPPTVESIELRDLRFSYRHEVEVIKGINLTVRGGQTVALVGASGAGKTTLTDLIARFADPTAGSILLNGVDLRRIRLAEYRAMLGVVQQEVFLFDGSVAENIAYGRRHAAMDQVVEAAKLANADRFIREFPEGYDTLIGERGVKLSGGQRQRLSIARAILANPKILILDEATSALDSESEQLIQQSLTELLKGRTTFVIAHRLSTITHADLIVVLEDGRVVERGTHVQLMRAAGSYAQMVDRQQRSFDLYAPGVYMDEPTN